MFNAPRNFGNEKRFREIVIIKIKVEEIILYFFGKKGARSASSIKEMDYS